MVTRSSSLDGNSFPSSVVSGILSLVTSLVIVASDVHAESTVNATGTNHDGMEFMERFQAGSLSKLDLILLVSLGVLAMEAVNFLSYTLGGMFFFLLEEPIDSCFEKRRQKFFFVSFATCLLIHQFLSLSTVKV